MTRHYSDLGSVSDWLKQISRATRPIRSTTQIQVVTRHQYGISALVSQTSFRGETSYTLNINWTTGQTCRGGRKRQNKGENENFTSFRLFTFTYVGYQMQDTKFQPNGFEFWSPSLGSNWINWDLLSLPIIILKWLTDVLMQKIFVLLLNIFFLSGKNKKSLLWMAFLKSDFHVSMYDVKQTCKASPCNLW